MPGELIILNAKVHKVDLQGAVETAAAFIETGTPHQIITLNAETCYLACRDFGYRQVVNSADLVTPDGTGILWAARRLGSPLKERVTGIDLLEALAQEGAKRGWSFYLYGAAPGVASEAAHKLQSRYPGLKIAGASHGYLNPGEQAQLIEQIPKVRPQVLLVALGAPAQDIFIAQNLKALNVPVALGVGGSFDVIAGRVKRAPLIWQKLKLEWLYRILKEPKRFKRALNLPRFVLAVLFRQKKRATF